jgi:16S rRNA (uracil1498-N3)-methyltransferase
MVTKVLRKVPGDNITVTNGKGLKWKGELTQVGNKNTEVKKIEATKFNDNRYGLEIAIAPTKSNDRMEWFIEKATEIGITKIHFIKTENSERKKINLNRFQKIAFYLKEETLFLGIPRQVL